MYTLKQINQHVQHPQIGDVWIQSKTFDEIRVTETTRIDNYWRRAIANNCFPKFLVGEKFAAPIPGEFYESDDELIEILRVNHNSVNSIIVHWTRDWGDECIPDVNTYERTFTQEEWDTVVREPRPKGFGFELTEKKPEPKTPKLWQIYLCYEGSDFGVVEIVNVQENLVTISWFYKDGTYNGNQDLTLDDWSKLVDKYNLKLLEKKPEPEFPKSGVFDYVKYGQKFRAAFVITDNLICAYTEGGSKTKFKSVGELRCWVDNLDHTKIQEFGDFPERDSFKMKDAYELTYQIAYVELDTITIFKDGVFLDIVFANNEEFACWLHSMRRV